MKRFRCGDVVPGCEVTFTGTRDEILAAAADHARRDHGITQIPPELVGQIESLLKDA